MAVPSPPLPSDEDRRLRALRRLRVLDSLPEQLFDDIVLLASEICGTPIGLISLIDTDRQWFKARVGLDATETPRSFAFCAHAILAPDDVMNVPDAALDPRFAANPLVTGDPNIRFYAGAPVVTPEGEALGTVCVIDTVPRELTSAQRAALQALARQTAALLQAREMTLEREEANQDLLQKITQALTDDDDVHAGFRQRRRLATVGQLTGGIAHDFNNVLQTITGSLQLIERRAEDTERVRRWAEGGLTAARHGAELTSQLLRFSRNHLPDARPVSVPGLVDGMREMLKRALGPEMQLEITLEDADTLTLGDATQLEAAVLNMAINARDAMQGRGRLRIAAQRRTSLNDGSLPDGDYLALTVADDGPGMTPEVVQRAFEPFFTTKAADKGTGLGLAQVFGYALRAGGTARIASTPGAGTAITLWLKTIDEPVAELQAPCAPEASTPATTDAHVLLVDDDDRLRETLAELLSDCGYRVTRACSGAAALEAACRAMPDVALIDCAMAGMNGATLAAQLRALNAALPMIFVTGHADVAALRPTLGNGAVVLRKPVTLSELSTEIDRLLADSP